VTFLGGGSGKLDPSIQLMVIDGFFKESINESIRNKMSLKQKVA